MVDAERLARIVTRVRDDVVTIRSTAASHDLVADPTALAAVKYLFVTAIEGCVRAASHVASSDGFGVAESGADTVRLLGRHTVVDQDLAESVARAVGFRNVMVHGCVAVDDDAVRANLALLDDLDAFARALAARAAQGD